MKSLGPRAIGYAPGKPLRLLGRVRAAVRVRHYSLRIEAAYVGWVRRFVHFHGKRHPESMGAPEVGEFLRHLAVGEKVAASTQNQALSALLFLHREVLGTEIGALADLERAKRPERLPVVLTPAEVGAILAQLDGLDWLMASLLYGSGLRLMECVRLPVKDVDLARREIRLRDAKGGRGRVTVLPAKLAEPLARQVMKVEIARRPGRAIRGAASSGATTSTRSGSTGRSGGRWPPRASRRPPPATRRATASRPICSRTGTTSAPSRSCSATRACRPR
jgi:integrase